MRLFDAHCHLQDERLQPLLPAALTRARQAGVEYFLCCGATEADWPAVAALGREQPGVLTAFGLHPWHLADRSREWEQRLRGQLSRGPVGVGEIGLDHGLREYDAADQEAVFLAQYGLSCELRRPVTIHCRRAHGRLLELLSPLGPHPVGFIIHSYSGGAELIPALTALGAWFSFSGSLVRYRNARVQQALRAVPLDRLLIETDAPDLPPFPPTREPGAPPVNEPANSVGAARRAATAPGAPPVNEPANLVYVLREAAAVRAVAPEELADVTFANACRLLASLLPTAARQET